MEKAKARIKKLNDLLIKKLHETIGLPIYQDSVSEDEQVDFNYFIFETIGFQKGESNAFLVQEILLRFISENRDDLDEITLDIIAALGESGQHHFQNSNKVAIRKGETDSFIDEVELTFTRTVKIV